MIAQPDLWSEPPFVAGSSTSYEASQEIKPTAGTLRARVLEVIATHPGISDERGAHVANMNPSTWRPRRIELERAGLVEKAGATVTQAGRKCWGWQVVPGK